MPRTARSGTATTDHDEIRKWVEARGGTPAAVKRPTRGDAGILRIDFPGFSGKNLKHISWDEWFETFDEAGLAFLHRDQDRFNKLVRRGAASRGGEGRAKGARTKRSTARTGRARATGARRKTGSTARRSTKSSRGSRGGRRRA